MERSRTYINATKFFYVLLQLISEFFAEVIGQIIKSNTFHVNSKGFNNTADGCLKRLFVRLLHSFKQLCCYILSASEVAQALLTQPGS